MAAYDILDKVGGKAGWDDSNKINVLCQYIDNQQSLDAFKDFVEEAAQNEVYDQRVALAKLADRLLREEKYELLKNIFGVDRFQLDLTTFSAERIRELYKVHEAAL